MIVEFTEPARKQYFELLEQYDCVEFGDQFIDVVADRIENIKQFPLGWPKVYRTIRKCNLGKFPYALVYQIVEGHAWILAISHHKRRPVWWKKRIIKSKKL
ncbi:MAG: type II toxin-antitoxin system RelE/ParE family toxin [Planctomycetota bacterium]